MLFNTTYEDDTTYETWFEKRERIHALREEAEYAFFSTVDRISYQSVSPIPDRLRSDLLRCCWNQQHTATYYQTTPTKMVLCHDCSLELKRLRTAQWRTNKRWKNGEVSRMMAKASQR